MSEKSEKSTKSDAQKVIDALEDASVVMLTSVGASGLQAHPMTIQKVDETGNLWFFVPADSAQAVNVGSDPRVNVAIAKGGQWVSVSGTAKLVKDSARVDELWDDAVAAYFEGGKADPRVTLLHVTTESAEYWGTSGGTLGAVASVLKAKATGDTPKGENAETTLPR